MDNIQEHRENLKRDIMILKRCIAQLQANTRISIGPKSLYSTITPDHPSYPVLHTLMLETLKKDLLHLTKEYAMVNKTLRLRVKS